MLKLSCPSLRSPWFSLCLCCSERRYSIRDVTSNSIFCFYDQKVPQRYSSLIAFKSSNEIIYASLKDGLPFAFCSRANFASCSQNKALVIVAKKCKFITLSRKVYKGLDGGFRKIWLKRRSNPKRKLDHFIDKYHVYLLLPNIYSLTFYKVSF